MDKDSQFNMIVYVRKNNYMEGSGSATIKKRSPFPVQRGRGNLAKQNQNSLLVQRQNDNIAPGTLGREDESLALTSEVNLDAQFRLLESYM